MLRLLPGHRVEAKSGQRMQQVDQVGHTHGRHDAAEHSAEQLAIDVVQVDEAVVNEQARVLQLPLRALPHALGLFGGAKMRRLVVSVLATQQTDDSFGGEQG